MSTARINSISYAQIDGYFKPSGYVFAVVCGGDPFWTGFEYSDGFDAKFWTAFAAFFDAAVGNNTIFIDHETQAHIAVDVFVHASFWINKLIGYVLREGIFPAKEAGARTGTIIMATLVGMALGGWLSGEIYDWTGSYTAAFLNGVAWNVLNLGIALWILYVRRPRQPLAAAAA